MSALQWAADQADSLASLLADEELRNWHVVRVDESGVALRNRRGEWADIDAGKERLVVREQGKDTGRDRQEWYAFTVQPQVRPGDVWDNVWRAWREVPLRHVTVLITSELGWRLIARYGWQGVVDVDIDARGVVANTRFVTGDAGVDLLDTWRVHAAASGPAPRAAATWAEMVATAYLANGRNVRLAADDSLGGSFWRVVSYGGPSSPAVRTVTIDGAAPWSWHRAVAPSLLSIGDLLQLAEAANRGLWFPGSGTPSEEARRHLQQWAARTALLGMGDRPVVESLAHEPGRRYLDGPPTITVHRDQLERLA